MANQLLESFEELCDAKLNHHSTAPTDCRIKVLIVDDHPVVRVGLRTMLESETNIQISGTAESAKEATMEIQRNKPDVVLMDLRMPEVDGARAIVELRRTWPDLRILVLTNYQAHEDILSALRAGAMGYLLKSSPQDKIVQAINLVHQNVHYVSRDIEERLLQMISRDKLTERELEVLTLVAKGSSNKEIAKQLFISDKTARNHVASCLEKLECGSRTEAVTTALQRGLIRLSE
jgi:DNA-binding NarL/FixJ family response regulator